MPSNNIRPPPNWAISIKLIFPNTNLIISTNRTNNDIEMKVIEVSLFLRNLFNFLSPSLVRNMCHLFIFIVIFYFFLVLSATFTRTEITVPFIIFKLRITIFTLMILIIICFIFISDEFKP